MKLARTLALVASLAVPATVEAQELGDPGRGQLFAARICAECHAVLPADTLSPRDKALPFTAIADTPGMTAMALHVWFRTPHPNMPNLILKPDDADDVVAYILSLRQSK
jgi:mono/diheme cytochrome c family protein